jgi:molybdenum cofactor cytidylyltransferase
MKPGVAALVLAAGASRRLGQPKQLLMHRGETLIERAMRLAAESGAAPVIVVLGAGSERIAVTVIAHNAVPVINHRWNEGISSSIHAGLKAMDAVAKDASGALILPCDQPRLTAVHLRGLIAAFAESGETSIAASAYAGVVGIPAVFPRAIFQNLLALRGDKGARALLADPPCPLIAVQFPGGDVDIDEPEDLAELEH